MNEKASATPAKDTSFIRKPANMSFKAAQDQKIELSEVEFLNFKSFEGHHIVGPFLNFTAIVGPNGGGKL